jgi:nucleolar GTP-binding protein
VKSFLPATSTSTNPFFGDIKPILDSKKLIDVVFKKAMKVASTGNLGVTPVTKARRTEAKRVLTCAKLFRDRLNEIVMLFPNFDEIPQFYLDSIEIIYGLDKLRKTLGSLSGTNKVIWKIYREHTSKIWHSTVFEAKKARRSAFSRFASVIKKLNTRLMELEELRLSIRKWPVFDFNNPILVIAGFPNVGKSSLIKSLTNANPNIADYPFTTKGVSIGHYIDEQNPYIQWQLVDTPGILDRTSKERNDIEKKALAAILNLPTFLLFLFDPTQRNDMDKQFNLYKELESKVSKPIYFLMNKIDLLLTDEQEELYNLIKSEINLDKNDIILLQANDRENSILAMKEIVKINMLPVH